MPGFTTKRSTTISILCFIFFSIGISSEKRLTDSLENVFELTEGKAIVDIVDGEQMTFSQNFACPDCGISIDEVEPRSFSFNNPFGACPTCYGLGYKMEFDPQLMVPDASLSISADKSSIGVSRGSP